MGFSVEIEPELTNIITIETSYLDTIETIIDDINTDNQTIDIIHNIYNDDIDITKNIIDIETSNIESTTNLLEIEIYQTYQLDIISDTEYLGNIHYSRVDGLAEFIDSRIPNAFDCGTP